MNRQTVTRRMLGKLDESYDDLVSAAMLLAELADSPETSAAVRVAAVKEWKLTISEISSRIVESSRKEASWASSRPKAV
jgi:hypothetical protein